jgi:hypothetical protein
MRFCWATSRTFSKRPNVACEKWVRRPLMSPCLRLRALSRRSEKSTFTSRHGRRCIPALTRGSSARAEKTRPPKRIRPSERSHFAPLRLQRRLDLRLQNRPLFRRSSSRDSLSRPGRARADVDHRPKRQRVSRNHRAVRDDSRGGPSARPLRHSFDPFETTESVVISGTANGATARTVLYA